MLSHPYRFSLLICGALFALPAAAADVSTYGEYPPTPAYDAPLPFEWQGAYVGVHGGLAFTKAPNPFADRNGLAAGAQAGYNVQAGPAIIGAELEGSYLGGAEHKLGNGKVEEKWRGAVKGRVGVSFDRTLVFGTAGYAMTRFEPGEGVRRSSGWKGGYLFGGGVERGFAGGLSAKMEYNYISTSGVEATTSRGVTSRDSIGSHVVKAGINYRF